MPMPAAYQHVPSGGRWRGRPRGTESVAKCVPRVQTQRRVRKRGVQRGVCSAQRCAVKRVRGGVMRACGGVKRVVVVQMWSCGGKNKAVCV